MSELSEIVGQDVNLTATESAPESVESTEVAEHGAQTPEQAAEQAPEQAPKVVPLAALHEERERRKEMARQIETLRQEQAQRDAKIEARMQALYQASQPRPPTFDENPAEHLRQQLEQTRQETQATNQQLTAWQQQQAQAAQLQQIKSAVWNHEEQFLSEKPDYQDAVRFMRQQRANEFQAMGADPQSALNQATHEMIEGALLNAQAGRNPAQVAYRMAELRGYRPKPQGIAEGAEKLQNQQRGVAAARTIGSGGSTAGKLSVNALATMSDEDFAEATKGRNWEKLMGG